MKYEVSVAIICLTILGIFFAGEHDLMDSIKERMATPVCEVVDRSE
jgi:hypothetical protein